MNCPNYTNCQLIRIPGFLGPDNSPEQYINDYCTSPGEEWNHCKRYNTWQQLKFCPDFVLPDTVLSLDEIIDRFDEELTTTNNISKDYGLN